MSTTNILDLNNRIDELEKNGGGYVLPAATASRLGGVKIGSGISVENDGTISASGASADSAKRSDIATEFSDATAYTAGCFVYHEGTLYQFNADHAAGAWDPTDVVAANVTDQVVSNKAYIDGVDEDLGEISDNLNGFKFYPAGTAIVGLVSDDSPYTDSDGNYILADSTTGQSMIDEVTYKSIDSTVDARGKVGADTATPFKSGGTTLVDINPMKADDTDSGIGAVKGSSDSYPATIRVKGYSKVAIKQVLANPITYQWLYDDGTKSAVLGTTTRLVWTDYIDIPSNAAGLIINCNVTSSYVYAYTSLLV